LILNIRPIAVLIDPNAECVLFVDADEVRHVKLGGIPCALRISDLGTVYPAVKGRVHALEP
jgi:hypothetical protein